MLQLRKWLTLLLLLFTSQQLPQQGQQLAEAYATFGSSYIYKPPRYTSTKPQQQKQRVQKQSPTQTLQLYDPKTGRQLQPLNYMPILTGNKRRPTQAQGNLVELPTLWNPCTCTDNSCKCCLGLKLGELFNQRFCVTLQYNVAQISVLMRINVNKRNIINFEFSARNPPAYCIPVLLPFPVYACLRVYDIQVRSGNVQICLSLVLNAFMNQVFEFHFDCVRFGASGVIFVRSPQREMEAHNYADNGAEVYYDPNAESDGYGEEDYRHNIRLEEDYSGISVEQGAEVETEYGKGLIRKGKMRS